MAVPGETPARGAIAVMAIAHANQTGPGVQRSEDRVQRSHGESSRPLGVRLMASSSLILISTRLTPLHMSCLNIVYGYTEAVARMSVKSCVIAHAAARFIVSASSVYTDVQAARTSGVKASPKPFSRVQRSAAPTVA
jgi:hypothetical protein